MRERWEVCEDIPVIAVSNLGNIENTESGRLIPSRFNKQGIRMVTVTDDRTGLQHTRSVALMVARAFVDNMNPRHFTSVIHLNGDREDCRAMNLMWRSRPFALRYHQMFDEMPYRVAAYIPETKESFPSLRELCTTYGLIERVVYNDSYNKEPAFPYNWKIELVPV